MGSGQKEPVVSVLLTLALIRRGAGPWSDGAARGAVPCLPALSGSTGWGWAAVPGD